MSQRVITFHRSALGTTSWECDRDSLLTGCFSVTANVLVSEDPAMTYALASTPTTNFSGERLEISTASAAQGTKLQIPIESGTTLYLNFSAAGSCWLLLEDAISLAE